MKQYKLFGAAFFVALLLMVLLAETIWALPFCLVGMVVAFICGGLWREANMVQKLKLDGVDVEVYNVELPTEEIRQYLDRARLAKPGQKLLSVQLTVDGEDVDIVSEFEAVPFERIRRITGYLTGRYGKVNNAKKAEIADRVSHDDRDLRDVLEEVYSAR